MITRTGYKMTFIIISVLMYELLFWVALGLAWYSVSRFLPTLDFQHPQWWWILIALPIYSVLFIYALSRKNRAIKRMADLQLTPHLFQQISSVRILIKYLLTRTALALLVFAIIDPKIGSKLEEVKSKGIDIMIAVDVSKSMLAEDAPPNRLERAKYCISQLIGNLHGDRIGLVVFAGNAFVQMPITNDYDAARLFLSTLDTRSATVQGTAIGNAISLCLESFDKKSKAKKVIMIISDGENHEDNAIEAARIASENHDVTVHTIGIGSQDGTLIPTFSPEGMKTGFKKDENGTPVVTALNESMMRDIASAGKGTFTRVVNTSNGLSDIVKSIESMEKTEINKKQFSDYQHRFGWFLLPAILLLAMEQLLAARRGKWTSVLNFIE